MISSDNEEFSNLEDYLCIVTSYVTNFSKIMKIHFLQLFNYFFLLNPVPWIKIQIVQFQPHNNFNSINFLLFLDNPALSHKIKSKKSYAKKDFIFRYLTYLAIHML